MFQRIFKALFAGKEFQKISTAEINAEREYRRSLIPDDLKIPQENEIFRVERPVNAVVMITFAAPFTDGGDCILPIGTQIIIKEMSEPKPIVIFCDPVDYASLELLLVPENLRRMSSYTGYYLAIETIEFIDGIRLISA